ncbi:hypothetical protein A0H81_08491 [Grifola frondosa]|uniref:Fe2OG dioxygenase domain-containing protein n=1 Tax=Grifola frondosa TaxID=5627 RepID=A0A1C7M4Q1_GRIFR|nr:hypothetical protein A0H81_08491 [Grifola frondosa]
MSLVGVAQMAALNEPFDHISIIDLKDMCNPDLAIRKNLADHVRDVCINVGFLYLQNYGIPDKIIEDALEASKTFFSLPLERKMQFDFRKTPNYKGYNPLLSGNHDPRYNGDLHEGFDIGWEELRADGNDKRANDGAMAGANVWPADFPKFRESVLTYYHAAIELGRKLFPLFALALDLPEDFFDDKTKNAAAIMRVLHYPPQTGPVDDLVVGIGAHTDYECFTLLWQEPGIQALQVLNKQNQWIDAPPIPGTLVLNLGDQFARWTNDVFKSTVHRAINRGGVHRYSIPLFFGTDYDVKLELCV